MSDPKPTSSAVERLTSEFHGTFSKETVEPVYIDSYDRLAATAKVSMYLGLFAKRFARDRLRALGQIESAPAVDVPEVLFVCVHNGGRSQMVGALLKHRAEGRVHVRSAGSAPAAEINPAVIEAMAEIGVDISQEFPKPLTDEVVRAAEVVITMGCGDTCPVYPGKKYLDWELTDPAGRSRLEVRGIRDEIDRQVQQLLADLITAKSHS